MSIRAGWENWRQTGAFAPSVLRSAFRFALAILLADAILLVLFGSGTAASLGSYAAIIMLYSLDYSGSVRQRFVGFVVAWLVGMFAVALGALLSQPLVLAVVGALAVSTAFALSRVLRGFAAKAAVALQGPFFLALIDKEPVTEIPMLLAAWSTGSVVAILVGVLVFPRRALSPIRSALHKWLTTVGVELRKGADGREPVSVEEIEQRTQHLELVVRQESMPGAVGHRERAVAEMVQTTHWAVPAFDALRASQLRNPGPSTDPLLADSIAAFDIAAKAVIGDPDPVEAPDLIASRAADLESMAKRPTSTVDRHYPIRLISIVAMRMLWLSGRSTGRNYTEPDIGGREVSVWALLRVGLSTNSMWPKSAIRAGLCSATCVLLVGLLGIQHGLWIVMAGLAVTQVTFSGTANGVSSAKIAAGSAAGVLVAGLGPLLGYSYFVFVILLPVLAFAAVVGSHIGPFTSQFLYTPFALVNLATLEWATQRDLEELRLENIAIGVAVAAIFAAAIFPYGLSRQLRAQAAAATTASIGYLRDGIAATRGGSLDDAVGSRPQCVSTIVALQSSLDAARSLPILPVAELTSLSRDESAARDRLVGGDSCIEMAERARADSRVEQLAHALSQWWDDRMTTVRG